MKKRLSLRWAGLFAVLAAGSLAAARPAPAGPSVVKIVRKGAGYQLLRDGTPFFIKGAGGDSSKARLKAAGGNSFRTWGSDHLEGQLAEAQKLGMGVTIGIWLGHKEHGFDYHNADQVAAQFEMAKAAVLHYRNDPALLIWGLGNEMEIGQDDTAVWQAIEKIAAMVKQLDVNHPTMTVVAEIGGDKVKQINALCPDIDIIGINTYGGGPSIGTRYKAAGGVKPYIITEYGPPGTWESGKNAWGVVPELSSTDKAKRYADTYEKGVLAEPLCLGSYAFAWGNKQEATATWYGLMLPDGSRLGAVDTLTRLWSGKAPGDLCPVISSLKLEGPDQVEPGAVVTAALDASDPENDPLTVQWVLQADPATYHTGGGAEFVPPTYPDALVAASKKSVQVRMPKYGGAYRLYAYVRDNRGGAAVANLPLEVQDGAAAPPPPAKKARLPLVVVGEGSDTPFIPSGYMGNTGAIKMDTASTDNPRTGKTCLKVQYTASDNWGGVVWQSPANDWGDQPGGWDLTGAKKLTFWARGKEGGETVTFLFGLIGKDKPYFDTGTGKLDKVALTKEWKQYTIDLAGKDLSRIKSGFAWTLGASGQPITFYLDAVEYK